MRHWLLAALVLILPPARAEDYVVVVARQSSIGQLDSLRIRDIFLRHRSFEGSVKVVPVNLLGDEAVRAEFEMHVLMMDRDEINRYWIANHFQGIRPPATQASLQSIKAFIEKVDGAIGYLPRNMVDDNLRVIHEF